MSTSLYWETSKFKSWCCCGFTARQISRVLSKRGEKKKIYNCAQIWRDFSASSVVQYWRRVEVQGLRFATADNNNVMSYNRVGHRTWTKTMHWVQEHFPTLCYCKVSRSAAICGHLAIRPDEWQLLFITWEKICGIQSTDETTHI